MTNTRLFTIVLMLAFAVFMPVMLIAQATAQGETVSMPLLGSWLVWFWHSPFVLGGVASLLPVLAVDFQAFKSFKDLHELATYDWATAAFRAGQAFVVGGLGGSIFKSFITG